MLIPYTYSKITYQGLTSQEIVDAYLQWTLGFDGAVALRDRRINTGVDRSWTSEQLAAGDDLRGIHDCVIQTRKADHRFLLRYVHREPADPARLWTSAVEISQCDDGIMVAHGVSLSDPEPNRPIPPPAPPRITSTLLHRTKGRALPRELHRPVTRIPGTDAADWLKHILMDQDRILPVVVLTPLNSGRWPLSADQVAKRALGMVAVHVLVDDRAVHAFNRALVDHGFHPRIGVSNGAVRFYDTKLLPSANPYDHPLWMESRYATVPGVEGSDYVSIAAVRRQVARATPPGHYEHIETYDRNERLRRIDQGSNASKAIDELNEYLNIATADIKRLVEERKELEVENRRLTEEAQRQLEVHDEEISALKAKAEALEHAAARPVAAATPIVSSDMSAALRMALNPDRASLSDLLILIQIAYPTRIVVLPEAFKSARESSDFRHPAEALSLLHRLAGPYADALASNKPDSEAKRCFGYSEYAANEGQIATRGRRLRTFVYDTEPVEMLRHVKFGNSEGTATCLRIHFHWDGKNRKLVIGHCGRHLDNE